MPAIRIAKNIPIVLVAMIVATVGWGEAAQAQVVKGNGTAGTLPVWTGNSTIGNSIASQSGSNINVNGGVKASGQVTAPSFSGAFSGNGSGLSNVNASFLGGLGPAGFAQLGNSNTFNADQAINGNLSLTGSIDNTLTLQGNQTDASGNVGGNLIGGFGGSSSITRNSVASGVVGATIAGGGGYSTDFNSSMPNSVTANWGTVGGGFNNNSGVWATVAGGEGNTASGAAAMIGGGEANTASGPTATIGGGVLNTASADGATVAGGGGNTASGIHSIVPGGFENTAAGENSFAAGHFARATNDGSFVWSDDTLGAGGGLKDTGPNQFVARASGGFTFYTAGGTSVGATLASGSGSWSSLSDRNAKANLMAVDGHAILERLASLPIATWNYNSQSDSVRHMGPMAQDFREAFGLGEDEKHISTVDSEGVALAAIQALYQINQELTRQVNELQNQVARLTSSQ